MERLQLLDNTAETLSVSEPGKAKQVLNHLLLEMNLSNTSMHFLGLIYQCSQVFSVDIDAKHLLSFWLFALDNLSDWCIKYQLVVRRYYLLDLEPSKESEHLKTWKHSAYSKIVLLIC